MASRGSLERGLRGVPYPTVENKATQPDSDIPSSEFKSGFVAVVGRPNVGKSTLLNGLLNQTVAATSPKPQTTRTSQLAILTLPQAQIIFVDTPGIHTPHDRLGEAMDSAPDQPIADADVILVLFDLSSPVTPDDLRVADRVESRGGQSPLIVALNKADAVPAAEVEQRAGRLRELLPDTDEAVVLSALDPLDRQALVKRLLAVLPPGPRYFPSEQLTDRFERDIAADLIRSAAMQRLRDEVPYSLAVRIDQFEERELSADFIQATLFVERDSQKGIVIGRGGSMIREIGTAARAEIEAMLGREVYLDLRVKTWPSWRNDGEALRRLGLAPHGKD